MRGVDHVLGYTMEQCVLDLYLGGGTRVSTWIEGTGPALSVGGHDLRELLEDYVKEWFDNFCVECDRIADEGNSER
jgi:hypothetical protein